MSSEEETKTTEIQLDPERVQYLATKVMELLEEEGAKNEELMVVLPIVASSVILNFTADYQCAVGSAASTFMQKVDHFVMVSIQDALEKGTADLVEPKSDG
jgi:hypothetical protein